MATISFWGLLLIISGLSLVVKTVFKLEFSIFRIALAFAFIYWGIKIFVGKEYSFRIDEPNLTIFGERTINSLKNGVEYKVVFGATKYDLKNMPISSDSVIKVKMITLFGGSDVILPPGIPISVVSHTAFGNTELPDSNKSAFGTLNYQNDSAKNHKPRLLIETNTFFGGIRLK